MQKAHLLVEFLSDDSLTWHVPHFYRNTLAGVECQEFIMENFSCCTGTLRKWGMPRVFGNKYNFRLVAGFIHPLVSGYLVPEYIYIILCSKIWHYLQRVVRAVCVFLMLQLSFRSCGGNGSLRNGTGALLRRLLGGKGESGQAPGSALFFTQKESN